MEQNHLVESIGEWLPKITWIGKGPWFQPNMPWLWVLFTWKWTREEKIPFWSHHFQVPAVDTNDSHRIRSMSFQQKWQENMAPTSKSMGFEHMNFTCCISKSKKTMVIWLLLGCKRDVHLFSLRISATSVQSCTSICGTGPQCTQCLDWDKWRESRKGPLGGGLKDYSFSPRSLGKWANLTSNFLIVWNHQLWCPLLQQ